MDVFSLGVPLVKLRRGEKIPVGSGHFDNPTILPRASYQDHNVGVICGHGIVVVDVDRHQGQSDGFATLANLQEAFERLPETLSALTPRGGRHLYFRTQERLPNFSEDGIDFIASRKFVAAPPSVVGGVQYEWEDPEAGVADLPEWLLDYWKVKGRAGLRVHVEPTERTAFGDDEIKAMLAHIDPDVPHEVWIRIGMALHERDAGSFALWDEWSSKGEKYPTSDNLRYRWSSFSAEKPGNVTIGSLVRLARLAGWEPPVVAAPEPPSFALEMPTVWREIHAKILEASFVPQPGYALAAVGALMSATFQRFYVGPTGGALSMYQWIVGGTGIGKNLPLSAAARVVARMDVTKGVGKLHSHAGLYEALKTNSSLLAVQDECFDFVKEAHVGKNPVHEELFSTLLTLFSNPDVLKPSLTAKNLSAAAAPIENPRVSWLATMTDEDFHGAVALPGFIKGGFFGRLNVWASTERPAKQQAKGLDVDGIHKVICELDARMNQGRVVPMSAMPFEMPQKTDGGRIELYRELRKAERVWVWASLMALTEGRTRVSEDDVHRGLGIDSYQTQHVLKLLAKPIETQDLDMMEHEVRAFMERNQHASEYQLRKHVGSLNHIPADLLRAYLKDLRKRYPSLD